MSCPRDGTTKLPKDGLRAVCPMFMARGDRGDAHWIDCQPRRVRFERREDRDHYYEAVCCRVFGSCMERQRRLRGKLSGKTAHVGAFDNEREVRKHGWTSDLDGSGDEAGKRD